MPALSDIATNKVDMNSVDQQVKSMMLVSENAATNNNDEC